MLDTVQPQLTANVIRLLEGNFKLYRVSDGIGRPSIDRLSEDDLLSLISLRNCKSTRSRIINRTIYEWFKLNGQDKTPSRSLLLWAWKKGLWRGVKFLDGREQPAAPITIRTLHKSEAKLKNKVREIEECICRVAESLDRTYRKEQNRHS